MQKKERELEEAHYDYIRLNGIEMPQPTLHDDIGIPFPATHYLHFTTWSRKAGSLMVADT